MAGFDRIGIQKAENGFTVDVNKEIDGEFHTENFIAKDVGEVMNIIKPMLGADSPKSELADFIKETVAERFETE